MEDLVTCQICQKKFARITANHLKFAHKIDLLEYLKRFPNALLVSESSSIKSTNSLSGKKRSQETRDKMSVKKRAYQDANPDKTIGQITKRWCEQNPEGASKRGKMAAEKATEWGKENPEQKSANCSKAARTFWDESSPEKIELRNQRLSESIKAIPNLSEKRSKTTAEWHAKERKENPEGYAIYTAHCIKCRIEALKKKREENVEWWQTVQDKRVISLQRFYATHPEALLKFMMAPKEKQRSDWSREYSFLEDLGFISEYMVQRPGFACFIDYANPDLKIAVECNGCFDHACSICYQEDDLYERQVHQIAADLSRKSFLENRGWKMYTIWMHNSFEENKKFLLEIIENATKVQESTSAGIFGLFLEWCEELRSYGFTLNGKQLLFSVRTKEELKGVFELAKTEGVKKLQQVILDPKIDLERFSVRFVETEEQKSLFKRIIEESWTMEVASSKGYKLDYFIWDDENNQPAAIVGICSLPFGQKVISDYIGWDDSTKGMNTKNVFKVYVLGATNKVYGKALVGKLAAMSLFSQEVSERLKQKTGEQPIMMFVYSAYGRSSLYNRIKFNDELRFFKIGETSGVGTWHMSRTLYKAVRQAVKVNYPDVGSKLDCMSKFLILVGYPQSWLEHSVRREIYSIPLVKDATKVLCSQDRSRIEPKVFPLAWIEAFWRDRWKKELKEGD